MAAAAIAARTYARMVYSSCAPIPFRCSDGNGNKIHLFLDCEGSGTRAGPRFCRPKAHPPMGYAGPGLVPARSSRQAIGRPTRRVDRRRLPLCRVRPRPVARISARGDQPTNCPISPRTSASVRKVGGEVETGRMKNSGSTALRRLHSRRASALDAGFVRRRARRLKHFAGDGRCVGHSLHVRHAIGNDLRELNDRLAQ